MEIEVKGMKMTWGRWKGDIMEIKGEMETTMERKE